MKSSERETRSSKDDYDNEKGRIKGSMGKKKEDAKKDFVLACFKPADESLEPKSGKFPAYEKFAKLETFIIIEISRYYLERHQDSDTPEEDALDEFLDDYDRWVGDKDRHERVNYYLQGDGKKPKEEPIGNRIIDAMFGYFDGERCYDGTSYFKGMRDGLGDNPCPEHERPDAKKGGK